MSFESLNLNSRIVQALTAAGYTEPTPVQAKSIPQSIAGHDLMVSAPTGTGKTLIAEAMAGETGKPYVFVDPGAFINMFFGVGVLKVKSLFRKLRKLSLRYGGVIVFFDEADVLGNRGAAISQRRRMQRETPRSRRTR